MNINNRQHSRDYSSHILDYIILATDKYVIYKCTYFVKFEILE